MALAELKALIEERDEDGRVDIAHRVGERLCLDDLPELERRAAEALARYLIEDAIERVRRELSISVTGARNLSRDIALKIAHDVDSVSCPFLQATEIFSENDWQQLVLTISRGARVAVARRTSMSEGLAITLAQVGDSVAAQALAENNVVPMTPPVCDTLVERFGTSSWIVDKLAERDDLSPEFAAKLVSKVSSAARDKLAKVYKIALDTTPVAEKAESSAILNLIREVPPEHLASFVQGLHQEERLTYSLMLMALRDGSVAFFEAALSLATKVRVETIRTILHHGSDGPLTGLLSHARIPRTIYPDIWEELRRIRGKSQRVSG